MRYVDFVNFNYEPVETDVLCDFYVESQNIPQKEAMGGVAAESSIGTWTELTTVQPYVKKLQATVYQIEGSNCRIAYPIELFEQGNMPNILSSIAGNIFGLEAITNLRLNDITFPESLVKSFKGPKYGIKGIRKLLRVKDRPLVGTIIKPKLGLKTIDHAKVAYEAWIGGCDIVKDDENLSNQRFNRFEERIVKTLEMRDKAEVETGEKKVYMVNITADAEKMIMRAEYVRDHDGRYMMVDIITCGFSALQTLRDQNLDLVIHAHRAGHAAFTRSKYHGINMKVIAKIARVVGIDQLHVGTAVGKMSETKTEVIENIEALKQPLHGLAPVLPVASGGLHPRLVPDLIDYFGLDFVIQAGGGIHGHPSGSKTGALAIRQAVNAVLSGVSLQNYAKAHKELTEALKTWN